MGIAVLVSETEVTGWITTNSCDKGNVSWKSQAHTEHCGYVTSQSSTGVKSPQCPREICSIYRAQNDDYPQNNDRLEIQNAMVKPQRSVFKRIQNVFCWIRLGSKIQDSRCRAKFCPGTLNLESWIRGVFNRIRFEYVWIRPIWVRGESFALEDEEETYDLQALFRPLTHAVLQLKNPSLPKAEIEKTGVGTLGGGVPYLCVYVYIYICIYIQYIYIYI